MDARNTDLTSNLLGIYLDIALYTNLRQDLKIVSMDFTYLKFKPCSGAFVVNVKLYEVRSALDPAATVIPVLLTT